MTVPVQRTRSVLETGRFLRDLRRGRYCVPEGVRDTAAWLERHYPTGSDLFMAAHGSRDVFADPHNAGDPIELPAADVRLGSPHWDQLIRIINCAPVPVDFDTGRWREQWLDMPNPALRGETPPRHCLPSGRLRRGPASADGCPELFALMNTPDPEHLVLFLDFDGVLHPLTVPTADGRGRPYIGPLLAHGPLLAGLLAPWIDHIDIVIASTWAKSRALEEIKALLPEAVGQRVVGTVWDTSGPPPTSRLEAIARWIEHTGQEPREWIALDDDARGWSEPMRAHLVWCRSPLDDPSVQTELLGRLVEAFEVTDPLAAARDLPLPTVVSMATALLEGWNLDETQCRRLLDISWARDERLQISAWPPASIEAARHLLGLHAALRVLFPVNPDLRRTWIHRRNAALGGESPLAVMLDGGRAGVERVACLLRSQLSA